MKPYIVYAPPYHTGSAGIVVMHRLMQLLKDKAPVLTNQPIQNKKWARIQVIGEGIVDSIAIYPEIIEGNQFKSNTVVRYIMHIPGYWGGPATFDKNDILFVYSDYWNETAKLNLPEERVLEIPAVLEHEWPNRDLAKTYNLWYRGKGKQPEIKAVTENAEFLGENTELTEDRQDWLRERLSRCNKFFSYDVATAMIPIAIFSGCSVVLINDPEKSPCIANGTTEFALREQYRKDEEMLSSKIDKFIEITQGAL